MDFEEFLKKNTQSINYRLDKLFKDKQVEFEEYSPQLGDLFNKLYKQTKDGKRIRGTLVLLGYEMAGGRDKESVIDAACAIEIFQTSILAQDDVIDKSLTRRGKPALHIMLGGDHKAISQTICLSDVGIFLSFRILSSLGVRDDLKIRAVNFFSQALMQTVAGEMMDIELSGKTEIPEDEVVRIGLLKTARYTISGPLILGALLAGVEKGVVKSFQVFGDYLGTAFQIQDDILGIFGQEAATGKSAVSDIREGKATLLASYAFKNCTGEELEFLKKKYGKENITNEDVLKIRRIFTDCGALDYTRNKAENYFNKALAALNEDRQSLLYSLVKFLENRNK